MKTEIKTKQTYVAPLVIEISLGDVIVTSDGKDDILSDKWGMAGEKTPTIGGI